MFLEDEGQDFLFKYANDSKVGIVVGKFSETIFYGNFCTVE
jgi:hypothetical protein